MRYLVLVLIFFSGLAHAEGPDFEFTFIDAPYNLTNGGYLFPSMRQSEELSTAFYEQFHHLIGGENPGAGRRWAMAGFDLLSFYLPLGVGWMHEEWHRAVMGNRGVGSYNDIYNMKIGAGVIAVSHVDDDQLVRLKRDFPADQVRLGAAGMESQSSQNLRFEKRLFFGNGYKHNNTILWLNLANNTLYLNSCASDSGDKTTDEQNASDGTDVAKRDFTGLDCTGWVYDLFRPDEPYTSRGTHPSGIGINRYRKLSDLRENEKSFLRMQQYLSLLNLVDPFLYRQAEFDGSLFGKEAKWNARLAYFMTSFGYTVDAHLFLKVDGENFVGTLHNGFTDARYFPGLTVEWIDHKLPGDRFYLSQALTIWNQPKGQRLASTDGEILVDASVELSHRWTQRMSSYVGLEAKTPGWMAGNVFLDRNLTIWSGFRTLLF